MAARGMVPFAALQVLPSSVVLLHTHEEVLEAMLSGWSSQQSSRLLARGTIEAREAVVHRFATFTGEYPWRWQPVDVEDWTVHLRSGWAPAHSTLRNYQNALAMFCDYWSTPGTAGRSSARTASGRTQCRSAPSGTPPSPRPRPSAARRRGRSPALSCRRFSKPRTTRSTGPP